MAKSHYIDILIKSWKGLKLVSSLQHWTKIMLEMFVTQHTGIWVSLILIALKIQKK